MTTTQDRRYTRPASPDDFPVIRPMPTRWADNDANGHLNNAVYYQLFDTAINGWLGDALGADPTRLPSMAVVAESGCRYLGEVGFPQPLLVGLGVARLGGSSVTYRLALFADERGATPAAVGHWVHVYLDRVNRRPTPIPEPLRSVLAAALLPSNSIVSATARSAIHPPPDRGVPS